MFRAIALALAQLNDPGLRRYLWIVAGCALGVFAALWVAVGWTLHLTSLFELIWLEDTVDVLGGLATLVLSWMLFPGVIGAVLGVFLEDVAAAVEAKHYPDLPPPGKISLSDSAVAAVRFLGLTVGLNLLVLFFLFVPPLFPFVFYGMNGYLLSREYFEVVARRRAPRAEVGLLWRARRVQIVSLGVATALALTVPAVNLVAPVIATAALVHLVEGWRRRESRNAR